jgi:hypothetical protein
MSRRLSIVRALCLCLCLTLLGITAQTQSATYYPPSGAWARKTPAEVGMDAAKLAAAMEFAKARETNWPRDFSTQEKIFGRMLGSVPLQRTGTNGVIVRHGYIVGEFGDTAATGPTYSVARACWRP